MKRILMVLGVLSFLLNATNVYPQDLSSMEFLNRILNQQTAENGKSVRRLASGVLLWTDDPASRAIYEKLKSHIDFLSVTIRNRQDLVSYYRAWDGYLEDIVESLQRIRELILMKSNGIYSFDDRSMLDSEIDAQYGAILKTISWAQFNTKPIFASWMDDAGLQTRFKEEEFHTLDGLDRILSSVLSERAKIGALLSSSNFTTRGQAVERESAKGSLSLGDIDFSSEISNMKRGEILFFADLFLLKLRTR